MMLHPSSSPTLYRYPSCCSLWLTPSHVPAERAAPRFRRQRPPQAAQEPGGQASRATPQHVPPPVASSAAASEPAVPRVGWLWDRKAADTRQRLREHNFRPKKSLGQNFLLDDEVLQRIVRTAGVQPGDLVLEIGPGTGNLTRHLLAAGAVVTAVEKDYSLHSQLEQEFAQAPQLRVVQGDILRADLPGILGELQQRGRALQRGLAGDGGDGASGGGSSSGISSIGGEAESGPSLDRPVKVVANLPYNITKDCLLLLLPLGGTLSHLFFMLQDEVAVRLTEQHPGGPDWRAMNIVTQFYSRAQYRFQIDRRKYHPAPKVHGAVVDFELRPEGERARVPSERALLQLVKKAFSQRRKVIRNSLQPLLTADEVEAALGVLGLDPDARAQDLSLDDFVQLAWQVYPAGKEGGGAADVGTAAAAAGSQE